MAIELPPIPNLKRLPDSMPAEGAVNIVMEEGVPIFRASTAVLSRIEILLSRQRSKGLTIEEEAELEGYAAVDDYLSFVNRALRDMILTNQSVA
jgi:hypothetical protein